MKNFDLNALGVNELETNQLIGTNGGFYIDPSWLWYFAKDMAKAVVYLGLEIIDNASQRAAQDGYIPYADLGHR